MSKRRHPDPDALLEFEASLRTVEYRCISCGETIVYPAEYAPKPPVKHRDCPLTERWY